jgi:hypothetical protein
MAKTSSDLIELTKVMLEASNSKEKTPLPSKGELEGGWKGLRLGFVGSDYEPIPRDWTGLNDMEISELVSFCASSKGYLKHG